MTKPTFFYLMFNLIFIYSFNFHKFEVKKHLKTSNWQIQKDEQKKKLQQSFRRLYEFFKPNKLYTIFVSICWKKKSNISLKTDIHKKALFLSYLELTMHTLRTQKFRLSLREFQSWLSKEILFPTWVPRRDDISEMINY